VRHAAGNQIHVARTEDLLLVADDEPRAARDHHPDLLVRVGVCLDHGARLEHRTGEHHPLARGGTSTPGKMLCREQFALSTNTREAIRSLRWQRGRVESGESRVKSLTNARAGLG
jgi:hypothetical protein